MVWTVVQTCTEHGGREQSRRHHWENNNPAEIRDVYACLKNLISSGAGITGTSQHFRAHNSPALPALVTILHHRVGVVKQQLSEQGAQRGSAQHGNAVSSMQRTSAQGDNEAPNLRRADTANTIYPARCPDNMNLWPSNLQWHTSGEEAACGTGIGKKGRLFLLTLLKPQSCDHALVFQGSATLTMATSESLLSIPHICSLPRASLSCRF